MREIAISVLVEKHDGSIYSLDDHTGDAESPEAVAEVMRLWDLACERAAMFHGQAIMTIERDGRAVVLVTAARARF